MNAIMATVNAQALTSKDAAVPQLSIIIPMYNAEMFIRPCLESILQQEAHDIRFELIVVDDASRDNSVACVQAFEDPRIRLIPLTENAGTAHARNTGMLAARGEWIQFVDSDDRISSNLFRKFQEAMNQEKNRDINCFLFSVICEFESGKLVRTIKRIRDKRTAGLFYSVWCAFYKKELCSGFHQDQPQNEDLWFLVDMMCMNELRPALLTDCYYIYNRLNTGSKMASFNAKSYRKAYEYIMQLIKRADKTTRMYVLESFVGILFSRDIPKSLSVPIACKTLMRLLPCLPHVIFSGIRHDVRNRQEPVSR